MWILNAGYDSTWQNDRCGVRKFKDKNEQIMFNRMAELFLFLANKDDIVYVVDNPDEDFLEDMKLLGFDIPLFKKVPEENMTISEILFNNKDLIYNQLDDMHEYLYMPYIVTKYDEEIVSHKQLKLYGTSSDIVEKINNKILTRKIISDMGLPIIDGYTCSDSEEVQNGYNNLKSMGYSKYAIKEPYNSAGKGVYYIHNERQFNNFLKMIRFPQDVDNFQVAIEGWIDNKRDINYQIEIKPNGDVDLLAISEQIVSITSYKGSMYPAQISHEQEVCYKEYAQKIGQKLFSMGYIGIIGIDSIIDENGKIIPAIEFNARLNQSTLYLPMLELFENKHKKTSIRSFDIRTKSKITYSKLKELLVGYNLYFDSRSNEGIIILNSACLSPYQIGEDNLYHSRVFFASIYDENTDFVAQNNKLEKMIRKIEKVS